MSESKLRSAVQNWTSAQRLASENRLFAILDAIDVPAIPQLAEQYGFERALSLYTGMHPPEHWPIGPYLFRADVALLDWLGANLRQHPWGIFAVPLAPDMTLQGAFAHFRKFILITVGAEQVYLRFYDPRVLTKYLQRAPADKLIEFFGPCRFLGGAGSNPDELNWFWLNNGETLATEKKDS
ncbi:MAG TPA: DUF4123 domain-containing protein [Bryobacteraceae bacterium]|nr:DUF4123 domain-containing protein [Bryobacteraceae bacterium]